MHWVLLSGSSVVEALEKKTISLLRASIYHCNIKAIFGPTGRTFTALGNG